MRAKFICNSVEDFGLTKQAKLAAVYSDSPEDREFNEYTPSGNMEIMIDKTGAMNYFEPGKKYYLDFSEAPE